MPLQASGRVSGDIWVPLHKRQEITCIQDKGRGIWTKAGESHRSPGSGLTDNKGNRVPTLMLLWVPQLPLQDPLFLLSLKEAAESGKKRLVGVISQPVFKS